MSLHQPTISHRWLTPNSASLHPESQVVAKANISNVSFEETKELIKKAFDKIELSVSSYDTAWVAMVPSMDSSTAPCFPECVTWLLDNQHSNGSWGLPKLDPSLTKDALLSTLASVLALKRWGVGEEQMNKGLRFIELNFALATDEKQHTPIGFDIIFPGMIEYAIDLNLTLPLNSSEIREMLQRRDLELTRDYKSNSEGQRIYFAYVSEGLGKLQNWEMTMKHQRNNGSLFNSPSTTAAALTHLKDTGCLHYLRTLLEKFGHAVPTIYPMNVYARLCMVDNLKRLGIDRHFQKEITRVLDETYRCWLQGEEEIFLDTTTCAMAFRILRVNGYDVSSDLLGKFAEEDHFLNSLNGYLTDKGAALELYRASEIVMHPNELNLERQKSWISNFLRQKSSTGSMVVDRLGKYISMEIDYTFEFPFHASLERLASKKAIEHFNVDNTRVLKTSYRSLNTGNDDILKLAVEDFNICQSIHQKELKCLERWVVENRLDKLKFARQKLPYFHFSAAATFFSPELSDARISWAKNGVLVTVIDDFFDVEGSIEELVNLVQLVEKWDIIVNEDCCSEAVHILFSALHSTICELGEKANDRQGRCVTGHMIEIWLDMLKAMLREAKWSENKLVPTMEEYVANAYVSFALETLVLPTLYFVGPKLSETDVKCDEVNDLVKLLSMSGRLLNDIHSYERESKQGKLNVITLRMIHSNGVVTEEEAIEEAKTQIENSRREVLRRVLRGKRSVLPKAWKDFLWNVSKITHLTYAKDDGFSAHDMFNAFNEVINEPIVGQKT